MANLPPTRRTTSHSGSSRLSLSVGRTGSSPARVTAERHPLRQEWSLSYVHRPPGAKVDYEKEIRRIAKFGSIESFLHLYSHLTPPNELPPVTDLLVFLGRIGRPGMWEEMRDGGKFTLRLAHPITPLLYETLLFSLLGDQFDEADAVVGCVLSVRQTEDIMSVWVEEEGEGVKSGALKEKILSLLSLPPGTNCEYKSNRALLDAASKPYNVATGRDRTVRDQDGQEGSAPTLHHHSHRDRDRNRDGEVNGATGEYERDRPRHSHGWTQHHHSGHNGHTHHSNHNHQHHSGQHQHPHPHQHQHQHQQHHTHNPNTQYNSNQWHQPRDREREERRGAAGGEGGVEGNRDRDGFRRREREREGGW